MFARLALLWDCLQPADRYGRRVCFAYKEASLQPGLSSPKPPAHCAPHNMNSPFYPQTIDLELALAWCNGTAEEPQPAEDVDYDEYLTPEALHDPSAALAQSPDPQLDAYPDILLQAQDLLSEPTVTVSDMSYYAEETNAEVWPATLAEDPWALPNPHASCTQMAPTFSPMSSSLYGALDNTPPTPPQPQPQFEMMLPQPPLLPVNTIAPAQSHMFQYQAPMPTTPESWSYSLPSTPELLPCSLPSTPSTPSTPSLSVTSSSESDAWTSDSDSDYMPSRNNRASRGTRKNTKASGSAQRTKTTSARYSPYSTPPSSPASSTGSLFRPAQIKYTTARTRQVDEAEGIAEPATSGPHAWRCPHCAHRQGTRHLPDLRRHILTHYASTRSLHVCRGKPLAHASAAELARFGADVYELDGEAYIGGCSQAFSRRDALLRHLRNVNHNCLHELSVRTRKSPSRKSAARKARQ